MTEESKHLTLKSVWRRIRECGGLFPSRTKEWNTRLNRLFLVAMVSFGTVLAYLRVVNRITDGEVLNALVLFAVFFVTTWYARSTHEMVAETREQRLGAIQPLVLQKAIHTEIEVDAQSAFPLSYFSHFEV